jgi:hypothetical protein
MSCRQRHAMLRTSFDFVNYSEPLQLVHERVSVSLDSRRSERAE